MKQAYAWTLLLAAILAMAGCASRAPTIAHVHIGHAMTGWYETPNKEGLFVLAENKAGASLKYAQAAADGSRDLNRIKTNIARAGMLCDGEAMGNEPKAQSFFNSLFDDKRISKLSLGPIHLGRDRLCGGCLASPSRLAQAMDGPHNRVSPHSPATRLKPSEW